MILKIATVHTNRKCKYCKHGIFIGCGFYSLGRKKYACDSCVRPREVNLK